MWDDGDVDRREEVLSEMTSFGVIPGEGRLVNHHKMVH
jgi:hypothetical protein